MKVRLLPLAIGAAIAMPGIALADGPTVYGKMNVTYEAVDYDEYDEVQLNSNASRLGIKGSEEINDNLSVIYQAEYDINVDDGGSAPFSQRDIFAGLEGSWGLFKAGKFDSPLKLSQGKIDQFNDMQFGDIGYVVLGEERVSNTLQYSTPALADAFTINVAWMPGEDGEPAGTPPVSGDDGAADSFSAAVVYSTDMLYLAVAMDDSIVTEIKSFVDSVAWDSVRFTAGLKLDMFELGFLFSTSETSDDAALGEPEEQEGYVLSAGLKLGESNKLRAQYGYSETDVKTVVGGSAATYELTQYGIGFDHSLSKQSKLFANYIALEEDDGAELNTFQVGMEHKF